MLLLSALCCACSGEAVRHRILTPETISFLFVVVALSMALTPFMAEFGQRLGKKFDRGDMKVTPMTAGLGLSLQRTSSLMTFCFLYLCPADRALLCALLIGVRISSYIPCI